MPWKALPSPPKGWISANREPRAKFLVDESLGVDVGKVLRARGWNAVYASDLKLLGRSDEDVFAAAYREDRILLTHDRDFLNDRVFRLDVNPGLVILPGAEGQDAALGRALGDLMDVVGPFRETFRGATEAAPELEDLLRALALTRRSDLEGAAEGHFMNEARQTADRAITIIARIDERSKG
jgi:predicted nuclease of predicted toxin-antitoxin system